MNRAVSLLVLVSASLLNACSGAGSSEGSIQTINSVGGSGGVVSTSPTPTNGPVTNTSLYNPTVTQKFETFSGLQHFNLDLTKGELYEADQPAGSGNAFTITYAPRDATYVLTVADSNVGDFTSAANNLKFQDPIHRTAHPQSLVPVVSGEKYYQSGGITGGATPVLGTDGTPIVYQTNPGAAVPIYANSGIATTYNSDVSTFFYLDPGTTTTYVGYAGYVRTIGSNARACAPGILNCHTIDDLTLTAASLTYDRAISAYGINTINSDVPKTGTASFAGKFYALITNGLSSSVGTSLRDFGVITGTSSATVDFGSNAVNLSLNGNAIPVTYDRTAVASAKQLFDPSFVNYTQTANVNGNTTFTATGSATIARGGQVSLPSTFSGNFSAATFGGQDIKFINNGAAANSIEGGFFGPAAKEIGGAFRIVGTTPDIRLDILGAFVGK